MKIFCIGLSKTGTTSLANALKMLGYRTVDNMSATRFAPGDIESVDLATIEANDAFTDTPIPSFYQQLDGRYPGSRFILTIRDEAAWLKSCAKQFNQLSAERCGPAVNAIFEQLYQTTVFDEALFRDGYRRFIDAAKAYFADRPGDLLIMDVTAGDGWDLLCPFLERAVPEIPFPKANVTRLSWTRPEDLIELAQEAGAETLEIFSALHGMEFVVTRKSGPCSMSGNLRWLQRKLRYRGTRNTEQAAAEASRLSLRRIEAGLRKIDPNIPIVSPDTPASALRGQETWNHFWLVDPLNGPEEFSCWNGIYALSIALVQDRVPIMGVVHAPTLGTSYFGAVWRGTIKSVGGILLSESNKTSPGGDKLPLTRQEEVLVQDLCSDPDSVPLGRSLRLCFSPWLPRGTGLKFDATKEWQTAGAQVILKVLGVGVVSAESGNELLYDKEGFSNGSIEIR